MNKPSRIGRSHTLVHGLAIFCLAMALSFSLFAAQPAVVGTTNLPTQIVCCNDGVDVAALVKEYGLTPRFVYRYALNGFAAPMNRATITQLQADGRVLSVEADGIANVCDQTIPPGITRISADVFAVGHSNASLNVDVAILDSGIDPHPDLPPNYQTYFTFGTDGSDSLGHGTAVAGVLAAQDNGYGVVGVAPGVRVWNVKCIGPAPFNTWTLVLYGMDFATAHADQISVANVSIGNSAAGAPYIAIKGAVRRMVNVGIVVVAAAGNDAGDMAGPDGVFGDADDKVPAAIAEAMAVSAMDPTNDTFANFSNFSQIPRTNNSLQPANMVLSPGLTIDVAAPGVNILTTGVGSNYVTVSGTSFAAPHVAGLVALYIAANGRATNGYGVFRIRQAIVDNSLAQSQWHTNHTGDPDMHPEPLAMASLNWVTTTLPISVQPVSQAINSGNSVSFGVIAVGSTFSYQWLFNGTNLSDNIQSTGSTTSTLTITNIGSEDAGNYQVIVTDAASNTTTSAAAVLTVLPASLVQDGSFESPVFTWLVENTIDPVYMFEGPVVQNQPTTCSCGLTANWWPTPAGSLLANLVGAAVFRQDLATPLSASTNYNLSFLQSGYIDFHAPVQVIVSIAPTGSTNEVYVQSFMVASNADWTRQQASFSVPSNGLYSLRLKSIPGSVAFVDDVNLWPAPAVVTVTPPVFQNISRSGNSINLIWSAIVGQTHQLQYKTNLNQPNWLNLGAPLTATNTTVSTTDTLGPDPQRFYRVLVQ